MVEPAILQNPAVKQNEGRNAHAIPLHSRDYPSDLKPRHAPGAPSWHKRATLVALLALGVAALVVTWIEIGPQLARSLSRICLCRRDYSFDTNSSQSPPSQNSVSSWLTEYDNFAGERCERLLLGDASEQTEVADFATRYYGKLSCYNDAALAGIPCDELRTTLLGNYASSDEERRFPLAYGLGVHTCATQLHLLLRAIYVPHNVYCIHADGDAKREFLSAVRRFAECLPNVVLAAVRDDFVYKSASQLDADLECMRLANQSPVRWRYFLNVAGQDLPLKANYELVHALSALNGSSHASPMSAATSSTAARRWTHSHWCRAPLRQRVVRCMPPLSPKPPAPHNLTIYKSSSHGAFSRQFVLYALSDDGLVRALYDWLNDTIAPEEHFFATLLAQPNAPGGVLDETKTRPLVWGKRRCWSGFIVRGACILRSVDLPGLIASDASIANKFYFDDDPVAVRCLADTIFERKTTRRRTSGPTLLWRAVVVAKSTN